MLEGFLSSISLFEPQRDDTIEHVTIDTSTEQIHHPLNASRKEIRLIRVQPALPGKKRGLLECDLVTIALDEAPKFDALSYTWGGNQRTIRLNERRFKTTENVCAALSVFRMMKILPAGFIWVDAICINQSDIAERSSQVQLIREIYTKADRVRVWLGMGRLDNSVKDFFEHVLADADPATVLNADNDSLGGLQCVLLSHWWRRLWVVQEVAFASDVPVVYSGWHTVPWNFLIKFLKQFDNYKFTRQLSAGDRSRLHEAYYIQLRHICRKFPFNPKEEIGTHINHVVARLTQVASSDVTDPRDRIYGALGFMPRWLNIEPDYSLSTMEVYRDFALSTISSTHSLEILRLCRPDAQTFRGPSWVPCLRGHKSAMGEHYDASCRTSCKTARHINGELHIQGMIVDRIATVGESGRTDDMDLYWYVDVSAPQKTNKSVLENWYKLAQASPRHPKCERHDFWHAVSEQASIEVIGLQTRRASKVRIIVEDELDAWLTSNANVKSAQGQDLVWSVLNGSTSRTFSLTFDGRKVTSAARPTPGDCVAILKGSRHPFLLRPQTEGQGNKYKIVSACYCEEFMYGELLRESAKPPSASPCFADDTQLQMLVSSIWLLHTKPTHVVPRMKSMEEMPLLDHYLANGKAEYLKYNSSDPGATQQEEDNFTALKIVWYQMSELKEWQVQEPIKHRGVGRILRLVFDEYPQANRDRLIAAAYCVFAQLLAQDLSSNITDCALVDNDAVAQPVFESLLLATGFIIFETLLNIERAKIAKASDDTNGLLSLESQLEKLRNSLAPATRTAKWYEAIREMVKTELSLENRVDSLFESVILV